MAYSKAPFFKIVYALIKEMVLNLDNNIATYNENVIRMVCDYLEIKTKIYVSSKLEKDMTLKAQDRVIDICKRLHTSVYINAIGGKSLYAHEVFEENDMQLTFLKPNMERITYKQFGASFVPGLSIVDILMFNSSQSARNFLGEYSLEN
jgi:hypothetical protein